MKKVLIAILTVFSSATFAQQKIGHLNSSEILQALPEYKQMTDAVEKKKGEYSKIMETMYTEYEKKAKEVQEQGEKMTQVVLDTKVQEIKDLERRITDFEQKAQDDLQKYAQDLMKPLNDKYVKGVKDVAKENGFTYVLDIAAGGVVYFPEDASDVTELVKKKIGANLPVPAAPGAATAPKK
jgi:outer membrane protein